MNRCLLPLTACVLLSGFNLYAGPVILTTKDGLRVIEGELLAFDGEFFRVDTEHGALTLDGGNVVCTGEGCPDPDNLIAEATFSGPADMIHRLMPPLLERFADLEGLHLRRIYVNDDTVTWELAEPTNGQLLAVIEGAVLPEDEALVRLASREADFSLGRVEGQAQMRQDVIALDALVPVVSVDNPRAMITLDQFRQLLRGSIDNWSVLGGQDLPVRLHLPEGDRVQAELERVFPRLRFGPATWHADLGDLASDVAADPAALGLLSLSTIGNTVPLVIGGACGLSTPATRETIKSEDYPLTQPLFLHRVGARQPRLIREFIAFARSHEAQPVIQAAGFVDQGIGRIGFELQGDRLANAVLAAGDDPERMREVQRMIALLMEAERLTLTYRFRDGSSDLDPQSASNIRRLADALGRGEFDEKELIFVGFTDGEGPSAGNLRLSERRASAVRRVIESFRGDVPVTLTADGFGEIMPMACDDTAWGRQVNRRVEVWVRKPTQAVSSP